MRYLPLIALRATPALAETYTPRECDTIEMMFANCAVHREDHKCEPVRSGYEVGRQGELWDKHPAWGWSDKGPTPTQREFYQLCDQVCTGKLPIPRAIKRYCPT
jgi:hypothetical protein